MKPWRDRANTLGYISGGIESQASMLRQILGQLPCNGKTSLIWKNLKGKEVSARCEELCRSQLSTAGLVVRREKEGQWAASDYSAQWLENPEPESLVIHFHNNVKFIGELLEGIGANTSQTDLLNLARDTYGLPWSSLDQIRRRTGWLRSLGMLELWGTQVVRTPSGEALLNQLDLCLPEEAKGDVAYSEEVASVDPEVMQYLSDSSGMDQDSLRGRRPLIGYIPRGTKSTSRDSDESSLSASEAVRNLISLLGNGITIEHFRNACAEQLGITHSSFQSTLHALRHMGLIEQVAFNVFAPTADAHWLTDVGNEQVLVAYLHSRYSFFGEILKVIDEPSTTTSLTTQAKERFGYAQASNGEIRLRLGFLQDAGLAERVDWQRFRVTAAGKAFSDLLSLQIESATTEGPVDNLAPKQGEPQSSSIREIVHDLQEYGKDGNESKAFEEAIARAFQFLGFQAEHLGGPGRTDVLAVAQLAPGDDYRVIIDAKSSGSGVVTESSVKFDALRDHKRKHKADHAVVIGPDFATRLKDWAVENGVIMLQVDDLVSALKRHACNPISLRDMRSVLSRADAHRDEMADQYDASERRSMLIGKILALAFQEAVDNDPMASGFISVENFIYALRKEVTPRPTAESVQECLDFLSSPLVSALEENKGRYKLADSPHNAATRLRGIGASLVSESRDIMAE
ncbi:restriction endonuclease [Streptomyces sp. AC602_WCS936]|uniref:restriction endonuclease n=1 Tax=Streptomyces sp. AC602_WCS936 TaxID=2823685 RepID=UPI001C25FC06|nr:restriction endonuclease [Streptomyces sp. AC602_WCS936]